MLQDIDLCCGCSACASKCPLSAITMKANYEGFLYPFIDSDKCLECNICSRVCPLLFKNDFPGISEAYAVVNTDQTVRMLSSSGGMFNLLAKQIIKEGGIVFGASVDDEMKIRHKFFDKSEEIQKMMGAKYVQSELGQIFLDVKNCLTNGKTVFFSGTPCQIAGLYRYLGRVHDHLITQDIICHGVPSPLLWDKYISSLERKYRSRVKNVYFRDKNIGWRNYSMHVIFQSGAEYYNPSSKDVYLRAFTKNLVLRKSCYSCHFKGFPRKADITLGDLWGAETIVPEFDDDNGVSLVVVNSDKGKRLFSEIKNSVKWKKIELDEAVKFNPSAVKSSLLPDKRDEFIQRVLSEGYTYKLGLMLSEPLSKSIKKVFLKTVKLLYQLSKK